MSVTVHQGTTFMVTDERGDFDPESDGGFFHLDTRFLSRHELRLDGKRPVVLQPSVPHANEAWHFLTNPPLDGAKRSTLGIVVRRELGGGLREVVRIENFSGATARFDLSLSFESDFEYILTVKKRAAGGGEGEWSPHVHSDVRQAKEVVFELDEAGARHRTAIAFEPRPDELRGGQARFHVELAPRQRWQATIEVTPSIGDDVARPTPPSAGQRRAAQGRHDSIQREMPRIESDHAVLARAFQQASRDLAALRIKAEGGPGEDGGGGAYAIAAGIPWYMDLFGRDSLIASYESILHDPKLARGTIDALARLQGDKLDRLSEEAPGKILHEYRRGPLTPAAKKLIPTYPYYGTIDATPLFLITLSEYVRVTGDLDFAAARWHHVDAAVEWMRRYGDRDGDGLLEYQLDADTGLVNQGWKDSTDSIRFKDGRIATPPIALVEVQGYACDARRRVAELARHLGKGESAERLEEEAVALARRIRERYWIEERAYFAEALDGHKDRVDAFTSNPGHLLWAGVVSRDDARAVANVLLGPEMFSGFGVRTMGEREGGFNPVSYHNGSVWPHDNALILAGLVRYGLVEEAARLADALLAAFGAFADTEPPELFCGYSAGEYGTPVRYPTACRPQAWASGAALLVTRALLGLEVDALDREIALTPITIPGMSHLDVNGVPVGDARIAVSVRVDGRGGVTAKVTGLPPGWRRVEPRPHDG
ncbi:amylo-alpha-1,6-glucosidase [Anaeromyxobacter oryzisoli]|uniref:amylo-alpha-1,6-glucosidase n=1 Tax=Anaeromyxobacter oryzisoli TaxID=2925408 RepID=UPI0024136144|nr:glycogen debranching N-terminal domain-containing protein [Anaeromyxobacter sp. SG63]